MPKRKRIKTRYPGVYFVMVGKKRVYYIYYRREGEARQIEERAFIPGKTMTPARANQLRAKRITGEVPTNREKRETVEAQIVQMFKESNARMRSIMNHTKEYSDEELIQGRREFERQIKLLNYVDLGEADEGGE